MPKKVKTKSGQQKSANNSIISNAQENMSLMSLDSTVTSTTEQMETPYIFTKAFLQAKMEEDIKRVERKYDEQMKEVTQAMTLLKSTMTDEQLKIPFKMSSMSELTSILNSSILELCPSYQIQKALTPGQASKQYTPALSSRRRSRSLIRTDKLAPIQESPHTTRSSSVGMKKPRAIVTPASKYTLGTPISSLATTSKYTVQKRPARAIDQTVNVKRLMKAGEEAISTAGSPLFVNGRVPCEPEVYIPLENGVILNIDPEISSSRLIVPQLDNDTKKKLKIICDKLQRCLEN